MYPNAKDRIRGTRRAASGKPHGNLIPQVQRDQTDFVIDGVFVDSAKNAPTTSRLESGLFAIRV